MSIVTTFEHQCRTLASAPSPDENASRFLVGSQSVESENLLYIFEYKDDNNNLAKVSYKFPFGELWYIGTSSKYPELMTAVIGKNGRLSVSVLKLPEELKNPIEDDYGLSEVSIEKTFDLPIEENKLTRQCNWHPEDGNQLLTCNNGLLEFWDLNAQRKSLDFSLSKAFEKSKNPELFNVKALPVTDLRWSSLFNCSVIAVAMGGKVFGIDTRLPDTKPSSVVWVIEDSKCNWIKTVDFNPNSQYYLASGGDDCRANFWDLRKTTDPVLHIKTHTHWIWSIRYNPFHDQLVLSSSSDARVALMRVQSIASEPFGQSNYEDYDVIEEDGEDKTGLSNDEIETSKQEDVLEPTEDDNEDEELSSGSKLRQIEPKDELVKIYEDHDDSVYAAEWATDPWIFASLGFESRLVINKVPKAEKLNILF